MYCVPLKLFWNLSYGLVSLLWSWLYQGIGLHNVDIFFNVHFWHVGRNIICDRCVFKHSIRIGWARLRPRLHIPKTFDRICTDRNDICTGKFSVNMREGFWTYLFMCRIVSVSAKIVNHAIKGFLNSETLGIWIQICVFDFRASLNYEFHRTWSLPMILASTSWSMIWQNKSSIQNKEKTLKDALLLMNITNGPLSQTMTFYKVWI